MRVSREISLGSSLHRASTDALIGMTQHYSHTFEKLRFYFQFQSEPSFDPSQTSLYGHKEQEYNKWLKSHHPLGYSFSKKLVFKKKLLLSLFSFNKRNSKIG